MVKYDQRLLKLSAILALICACVLMRSEASRLNVCITLDEIKEDNEVLTPWISIIENLTACQHLRRAESRRSKALAMATRRSVRVPRCNKQGEFELIQCMNEKKGEDCWCVDKYGIELPLTRNSTKSSVNCSEPADCPASACRMFCPSGFERDPFTNCPVCRCRDPCADLECPSGQSCQMQEVKCKTEPCPPVPTCKKARSISNYCPVGLPLSIKETVRPFLCGIDSGKPQCPPLYRCMVEFGNDYGVCCPSSFNSQKPGTCPKPEKSDFTEIAGYMCGSPCIQDLDCRNTEKCCYTKGCQLNCQKPYNVSSCHQAKVLSEELAVNVREGRGYIPDCNGPNGLFSPKQCSRNGLVCWCVDTRLGYKIKGTMGAAKDVTCDGFQSTLYNRLLGRSLNMEQCESDFCAAVCEYGFKNDHNGCPTCECSEPCDGYNCPLGSHCEVSIDPQCESGSALCVSWPVCKPNLVYSNPCDSGTPLSDNVTGEVIYCFEERQARAFQPTAFFEPDLSGREIRSMAKRIVCPTSYKCTKLHREAERVCCPIPVEITEGYDQQLRQQTMCEYLRDFSDRMEGTEAGMQLAISSTICSDDGNYRARQCTMRKIMVTRAEQRTILEENTIRRMRMLIKSAASSSLRSKREVERIKLYRVDDSTSKVHAASPSMGRSAKLINADAKTKQGLGQLFKTDFKKISPASKNPTPNLELVEIEVEECWCVDRFGTEIPRSRGFNVTDEGCVKLRKEIDCLDLTCRMGCEYGFTLDIETRCPACQCRDPCEGITCSEGKECRIVDVSCEEEYCPPVPACLPRKPGQCPFLVPPGSDTSDANACAYECRTDSHCDGAKRCCSNGCGTQCVQPQMKTACQHLRSIQMHQSSELGIPAIKMHIAQCDPLSGEWNKIQCLPTGYCWCVDGQGQAISGTRTKDNTPICKINSAYKCPNQTCTVTCEMGYKVNDNGCIICECRNFCDELSCSNNEECQLIHVECTDNPCPKMPICVPRRASVCPEGSPLQLGNLELSCGPHNEHEVCPTTHTCQLNPVTHRGVCCTKTRDVCFESLDNTCLAKVTSKRNTTMYRFSPKANKCLPVIIDLNVGNCQMKNLYHNELACHSVCPVLTQCERLKLKNNLASHRSGQPSVWFQPRCDPVTGHWSPVQCLGQQPPLKMPSRSSRTEVISHTLNSSPSTSKEQMRAPSYGVCWCADKKGAPLKGTLTRDIEPICNNRQARSRSSFNNTDNLMEDLIRQMTLLIDMDDFISEEISSGTQEENNPADSMTVESEVITIPASAPAISETEHVLELANSLLDSQLSIETTVRPVRIQTTRCRALSETAPFPVSCDDNGGFLPTQCNGKMCWCVDAAGNQLDATPMFRFGTKKCKHTSIAAVAIDLHLENKKSNSIRNAYDKVRKELKQLLGDSLENLRVQENSDGTMDVRFELYNAEKIELAYAIESAINKGNFYLGGGPYLVDITRSHFIHRIDSQPVAYAATSSENTIQLVVFIMATSSAFLISVLVVYIMLKRGKQKVSPNVGHQEYSVNKAICSGDKVLDYCSPIFVLSAANKDTHQKSMEIPQDLNCK